MILSGQSIRGLLECGLLDPWSEKGVVNGRSYGLSHAGYDIRVDKFLPLGPNNLVNEEQFDDKIYLEPQEFVLASSLERFKMPENVMGFVKDKSSWARLGLSVFNTVIEPGWEGYLTLELKNQNSREGIRIDSGDPIAQIIFQYVDQDVENPYRGKYQNQEDRPVPARSENG